MLLAAGSCWRSNRRQLSEVARLNGLLLDVSCSPLCLSLIQLNINIYFRHILVLMNKINIQILDRNLTKSETDLYLPSEILKSIV